MKIHKIKWQQFLKENLLIVLLICAATWLRVWQLDSLGILFSDAGRDLLVAYESVESKTLPLLGIPSSVPRFKQGPISIWLEMAVISVFGTNTLAQSLVFALVSIAAVIGIYEFVCIYVSKKHALVASLILATSPLAVANGRVPYHTTPLPLAMVLYLFSLLLLWHNKRYSFFLAGLSFAFLFQFELAMAPLFLLIPFVFWWQKIPLNKLTILQTIGGIVLGLLPQIIFDITHKFAQIGVFFLWIGHKLYEFVSFKDGGGVHFEKYFSSFSTYGGRIFSTDYAVVSVIVLLIISIGFYYAIVALGRKKLEPAFLLTQLALLLLIGGYFIHGAPSEAYFPPFFILLPIHLAFTVFSLPKVGRYILVLFFITLGVFNTVSIIQHNFFVNNNQKFSYGSSTGEIRGILWFVQTKSANNYDLATFANTEEEFPSWFDNYRWLALEQEYSLPQSSGKTFYVESAHTAPSSTPFMIREFQVSRVYWHP